MTDPTMPSQSNQSPVQGVSSGIHGESHQSMDQNSQATPKRRKPPHVRSRASRACDRCKSRKTRCSGKYPCTVCSRLGLECKYTAIYRRGRLPSIEIDADNHHETTESTPRAASERVSRSRDPDEMRTTRSRPYLPSPNSIEHGIPNLQQTNLGDSGTQSSRNSPEPAQVDRQGHYVGPASGVSFLLRIQRKLSQQQTSNSSDSSIFTFGDLPLPQFDPRFLILPPQPEAESLVRRYFEFASATHRFLHRQTLEKWLHELYTTNGNMVDQGLARSRTALLLMVFAHSETFPNTKDGVVDPSSSARFFSAAEDQLAAEKGAIQLTSVQARFAQCLYLLFHSRLNHCWSLFGTTAHLMLALGIHRKSRGELSGDLDHIELECRKRTFWCAYNLDTYLSAALGRPRTFHDDDIDQDLPQCLDDHQLAYSPTAMLLTPNYQSVMAGSVAHIKLSRIMANILRDIYGIRPPSTENQYKLTEKYSRDIEEWRESVSYLVGTSGVDPSLLQPIFLRQRNVLNLAYWHTQILIHRPFLLRNFASLTNLGVSRRRHSSQNEPTTDTHAQACLSAAMNTVGKIDDLNSSGQLYNTFWFTHYFAFCAVVVLYVFAIQQRHESPETYLPAFHAASKCQLQISSIAIRGSLPHRYGLVLQELRVELLRHNHHLRNLVSEQELDGLMLPEIQLQDGSLPLGNVGTVERADPIPLPSTSGNDDMQFSIPEEHGLGLSDNSPGSSIVQVTGWGQFDSLVTGGMGDLQLLGWDFGVEYQADNII